ncbi:ketoacyl-synthetase C-terminal extension domain-containing protein, partial [Streptomyces sp. PT12]|uniref:ketoacyl-synthetase C-terminal extension domain-containing protein n=1 Tax=Streptomyces sp. PT12 TaxID=1510197 RepID=UPI000DFCF764
GISSFGISGTNAHTIIEEAPYQEAAPAEVTATLPIRPLPLSARNADALTAQAGQLAEHQGALSDIGFSLATTRATLDHRAVVIAADRDEANEALRAFAEGRTTANVVQGTRTPGRLAFLFTGQGSQRLGMGREVYEAFPAYAGAFDAVCERFELPVREV